MQDRAELTFDSMAYAPSVQIYSRDQNELRIGVDVKTVGIITAPFASVNVHSGAQCDGAIYAENINIEPGVIFNSAMVNPNRDSDSDFVPDGIEILPLRWIVFLSVCILELNAMRSTMESEYLWELQLRVTLQPEILIWQYIIRKISAGQLSSIHIVF
ncbi:MAG: hypothetical protein JW915_17145 [Chitinispirillaceae bacterium]|nr:hypothetical protein [Chitinispirillaceae bacterium]